MPVLFPFGYGLSYAMFDYSDLALQSMETGVRVSFCIENISERDGAEAAQVYVHECAPLVYRPTRELKDFVKPVVRAGEKTIVVLTLPMRAFAHWSTSQDKWVVTDGVYEIMVGASSEDIRLSAKIKIEDGKICAL